MIQIRRLVVFSSRRTPRRRSRPRLYTRAVTPRWARTSETWIAPDARGVDRRIRWSWRDAWAGVTPGRRVLFTVGMLAWTYLAYSWLRIIVRGWPRITAAGAGWAMVTMELVLPLVMLALLPWAVMSGLRYHSGRVGAAVARALAARRCPSCGYDLAAVPEGDGAIRTCPECAAGWRAP